MSDDRDDRRPPSSRPHSNLEQLRVPPQSVEAEQAVIGGLMLAPEAFDLVADLITEADFYRRDHRLIYRGIKELAEKNKPFDAVTLGEWFEANGLAEQIGGPAYLITLASNTPSAANVKAYAEIVREKGWLRGLIEAGTDLVNASFEPEGRTALEITGDFTTKLTGMVGQEPCELEHSGPIVDRMWQQLQQRAERDGALDGLATGIEELDRVLNGLKGGLVYYIGGRPKMGKSTLAQNIAEHVALKLREEVAFFSLEMPQEQVMGRMACSIARIKHSRFRTGQMDDIDWSAMNDAVKQLKRAPLFLSRPSNTRVLSICAQARRRHAKKRAKGGSGLRLVVIDYLQLIAVDQRENRAAAMGEVSRMLKMLAIELNVPVVVLTQLSRKCEDRPNKRPTPADTRDTGAIEQDCDALIFVYRDEVYHKKSRDKGTAELDVALQRDGPSEVVRVLSKLDICRFENLPLDWEPAPVEKDESAAGAPKKAKRGIGGKEAAAGADA